MIRRWPIRVRLTAAFAVTMALVLAGVAIGTVIHERQALDRSISEALLYRVDDLQPNGSLAAPVLSGDGRDTAEQVLDADGRITAASRGAADAPLLPPSELAAARHHRVLLDRAQAGTLAGPVRIAAAPAAEGRRIVVTAVSLADRDAAVDDLTQELALAFPLVLLAATAGAFLLATGALRPVERMRARAAAITAEDLEQRLPLPAARDEVHRLGTTLNDLLARLNQALLRERRFVADASHELRTPLGLLTTELELALRRPRSRTELTAALHSALEETGRLSRLAQDLLLLARTEQSGRSGHPRGAESCSPVRPLLEAAIDRYRTRAGGQPPALDCPLGTAVQAPADDCDRAISNLIDNALQHGASPIAVQVRPAPAGDRVTIRVRDHGPGFDAEFLPRAFDRFSRADTARSGAGSGLGLAITLALARRHGGTVTAANHPDGGAVVTLELPAAPELPSQSGEFRRARGRAADRA